MKSTRQELLHKALFRGEQLSLANPAYLRAVSVFLEELLSSDLGAGDLTAQALQLHDQGATAAVIAKQPGVAAGLSEFAWLYSRGGIGVQARKKDGEAFADGETLLEIQGRRGDLLAYERVGLNLLQRLSGIATTTRH
jgi:nicotinate-nucleotide pyrophosphorylase (carboxylating)